MINEIGAAPRGYLAAFARLLEQVEITTDRGERLDLDDAVDALRTTESADVIRQAVVGTTWR